MQKVNITTEEAGQRLDRFLEKYFKEAPKSFYYKMLRKKNIVLNGKKADGTERLVSGDEISLFLSEETIEKFRGVEQKKSSDFTKKQEKENHRTFPDITVIYEDEHVLVVNKPVGVLSQKAKKEDISLTEWVQEYVGKKAGVQNTFRAGICNRLDRNTTGLVAAGKTVAGLQFLNRLFRERNLKKYYLCLVKGILEKDAGIKGYLKKNEVSNKVRVLKEAEEGAVKIETAYHPLEHLLWNGQDFTLLKVHLITGKAHQIRAHLQSIGNPVAGDFKYGDKHTCQLLKKEFGINCQLLHAWKLCLGSPAYLPEKYHGMEWTAPLPDAFENVLRKMRKERG